MVSMGGVIGLLTDLTLWYGVLSGLLVAVCCVVPIRGSSLPRWAVLYLRFRLRRGHREGLRRGRPPRPLEVVRPDGSLIGLRRDGRRLVTLIKIEPDPNLLTVLDPAKAVSGATLDLRTLAEGLQCFDTPIHSMDVLVTGSRNRGHGKAVAVYEAVLGPLPAIAHRTTYVVVRLDPMRCADAVRRRGGPQCDAAERVAATAAQRVANRLSVAGLRTRILSSAELDDVTDSGADLTRIDQIEEDWSTCRIGTLRLQTFAMGRDLFCEKGLASLWTSHHNMTTVCVSIRTEHPEGLAVRGMVRFVDRGSRRPRLPGLIDLPGRQYAAMLCTLPIPDVGRGLPGWLYGTSGEAVDDLTLPTAGCGQVIGADENGRAVAAWLFGPGISHVEMHLPLHFAQQMVLRALAVGARIRVHTRRGAAWRAMRDLVADDGYLTISDADEGDGDDEPVRSYSVELFDEVVEHRVADGATTISLRPWDVAPVRDADVTLQLTDPDRDAVRITTPAATAQVAMIATDEEMRYLASPAQPAVR